jgi:MYXO-CTERM domain-containing protein
MSRFARGLFVAIVACLFFASSAAVAQDRIVQNDSLGEQQEGRIGSAELVAGEGYYVTLTIPPAISLPVELLGVRVVMVDSNDPSKRYCGRFHVEVFEESTAGFTTPSGCPFAQAKDPGNVIYSMSQQFGGGGIAYEVEGNAQNLQDLRFSQINNNPSLNATINPVIINTRTIRIGIKAVDTQCQNPGDAFPIIVSDLDGTQGDNFVYGQPSFCSNSGSEYFRWRDFAQFFPSTTPSDFVIRAIFPPAPGGGDPVVVDAGPDGSTSDTGGDVSMSDVTDDTSDDGGTDDTGGSEDVSDDTSAEDATAEDTGGSDGGGEEDATTDDFSLMSVSPSKVPTSESTNIAIVGSGFEPGASVRLNADAIGVVEVESGLIDATIPEGFDVGMYDLIVSNPDGETASLSQAIEVYDPNADGDGDGDGDGRSDGSGAAEGGCGCASSGQGGVPVGGLAVFLVGLILVRVRRRA